MRRKIIMTATGLSMGILLTNSVVHVPMLHSSVKTRKIQATSINDLDQSLGTLTRIDNDDVKDGGTVQEDFDSANMNWLSYAAYFHIFARSASLTAHTNGNLAVGVLDGQVDFGTKNHTQSLEEDIHYIQDLDMIAKSSFIDKDDMRSNKVVFGSNLNVDVSGTKMTVNEIDLDHLQSDEIYQDKGNNVYIDFESIFEELSARSVYLIEHDAYDLNEYDLGDRNSRTVNLKDFTPNNRNEIVINLPAHVLNMDTPLTIDGISSKKSGTTVIINVDTEGASEYDMRSPIKIKYDDGTYRSNKETDVFDDNHLIWNFYDSNQPDKLFKNLISMNATFQGSVLAPQATVDVHQNLDGNIVANDVNIVGGETHRWDHQDGSYEIPQIPKPETPKPETPEPETPEPETPEPETPEP
ncbi:collagen-binding domain-containing protein, partial [Companilactobacillus huachuanensis]